MLPLIFSLALDSALVPMRSAETLPPGATRLHLNGGLSIIRIDLPSLPVVEVRLGGHQDEVRQAQVAHDAGD